MTTSFRFGIATASVLALALSTGAAHARETSKSCHQKFTTARTAGTLNGQSYKDFKTAQCGDVAAPETKAAEPAAPAAASPVAAPAAPAAPKASAPAAAPVSTNATLPDAVSPKYSKEAAGKARLHTCLDQYNANKATNANGGLRWIQRGGGYYSVCNARLKG
ncbi:hypothetical protein [Komagataeibacter oboediens]|uniref:Uncharacterized protein n=1 Tax=Komagataeibacter oboediens TaxID=65958 RepID=A0ABS5SIQ9_9PROT|nr:hypothetical protein [Komagataeibacter oboediens]MBL7233989.1 hypothetical protein [Komagataeibacter oboediens]MBT0674108.1 hypothetical protein [Komagataeibacter oboediens]MBT0677170.1 hypothetical protein [Komagataeibacter oboediens]MBV0887101.1 hypothetical protein [Komagataeibacter oboediens]MCK9819527.1 hypothetical protein [Komagataeibacter oboediens]